MAFPAGRGRAATGGVSGPRRIIPPADNFNRVPPERRNRTVGRIVAFFSPYKAQVTVVITAILATSLLGLVNPLLLKLLIDDAIPNLDFRKLNLYVGLMIVVPIVNGLIGIGQTYLSNVVGQNVMADLRSALYAHLQRMPLRFFTVTRTGEIQSRLANDVGGIQAVVTDTASSVTSNIAIAISTVLAMFLIDWRLPLLSLGLLPFFMLLTQRVGRVRREVSTETQIALADMSAATEETLSVSGVLLTKTFGQQPAALERFQGLNLGLARLQIRQAMVGRWFFMIIGTIFSITPAFVYWLAGYLAINNDPGAPTIGDIVAFTTLQSRLFFPLGQLLNVQVELQGALALFDRIFEYLDMDPEIVDAPDAVPLEPDEVRGSVRFRDVTFRYPAEAVPAVPPPGAGGAQAAAADGNEAPPLSVPPPPPPAAPARSLVRAARRQLRGTGGRARRARRAVRSGQDDDDVPHPSPLRRHGRRRGDRRPRRPQDPPRVARPDHRLRDAGDVPVPRVDPGQPPIRQARRDRGGARGSDAGRSNPRPHRRAPRRPRHHRRRARLQALGWREAADRHRASTPQGSANPHPRRGDVVARHGVGAPHPGRDRPADRGPHDD